MVRFLLFFLIIALPIDAQIDESFDDGDFTSNPAWSGTMEKFIVDSQQRLQLNAPQEASSAWLFTRCNAMEEANWQFDVVMGFNPSSSNHTKIWIAADKNDPAQIKNGIFISLGSSDDAIMMQMVREGKTTTIIKGSTARLNRDPVNASVKLSRNANQWSLDVDLGDGWINEGTAQLNPSFSSEWFGIVCVYTQTRSNRFWFDNIRVTGIPRQDREKPFVTSHQMNRPDRIEVLFNEPIITKQSQVNFSAAQPSATTWLQPGENIMHITFPAVTGNLSNETLRITNVTDWYNNTLIDTTLSINYVRFGLTSVNLEPPSTVILHFNNHLGTSDSQIGASILMGEPGIRPLTTIINGSTLLAEFGMVLKKGIPYQLNVSGITDIHGNTMDPVSKIIGHQDLQRHSVVITEFMSDPDPTVGLPNCEYIELYNTTPFDIDLKDWKITVNQTTGILPAHTLAAHDYVVLCPAANASQFNTSKKTSPSRWPAITNSGASIVLTTPQGITADALRFDMTNWGDQTFKDNGGWSFEIIDIDNRSANHTNWSYSGNLNGGTPAEPNSNKAFNPDTTAPVIQNIKLTSDLGVDITFSEPIDITSLQEKGQITINGIRVDVSLRHYDDVFNTRITLLTMEKPVPGTVYHITGMPINDWAGNQLSLDVMARYGIPEEPFPGDVAINEIMFNTTGNAPDYLEILNTSNKVLSLNRLSIGKMSGAQIKTLTPVTVHERLFFPGDYIVSTPDSLKTISNYNCAVEKWVVKTSNFPSLSDDGECLILAKGNGETLESFCYDKKMHHPLLKRHDGVSLERVDPKMPANIRVNWQTAAASSGYSTPTSVNSQYKPMGMEHDHVISLSTQYFTPDGDGTDDYLMIQYKMDEPGWNGTVKIHDARGRVVRWIANNEIMGMQGLWQWDGLDGNNQPLARGNYLIFVKLFHPYGGEKVVKKSCTIGLPMKK